MEAVDLRLGNWVSHMRMKREDDGYTTFYENMKVTRDILWDMTKRNYKDRNKKYQPIPLTEEILLKAGFEKRQDTMWTIYNKSWISLYKMMGGEYYEVEDTYTSLKYVHSLQNLYFALTGEELEIEL